MREGRFGSGSDASAGPQVSQSIGAWTSAVGEFVGRIADLLGRQSAAAVQQAIGSGIGTPSSGWLSGLIQSYRDTLGELALLAPSIAQRLDSELQELKGRRLLMRIRLPDDYRTYLWTAIPDQQRGFAVGHKACELLIKELGSAGFPVRSTQRKQELDELLRHAEKWLDSERLRDVPTWLDELKAAFRRGDKAVVQTYFEELKQVVDVERAERVKALIEAMQAALGEHCVRRVLRSHWLRAYAEACDSDGGEFKIHDDVLQWLQDAFQRSGIRLSDAVSLLANKRVVVILDHEHDRTYDLLVEPRRGGTNIEEDSDEDGLLAEAATQTNGNSLNGRISLSKSAGNDVGNGPLRFAIVHGDGKSCGLDYRFASSPFGQRNGDKRIRLPLRISDGSQAIIVWYVDKQLVQEALDDYAAPNEMRAWDIGGGLSPVALFFLDWREGDLEPYRELGFGCFASPKGDPLGVGLVTLDPTVVTTTQAACVGRAVWGFEKCHVRSEQLVVHRAADTLELELRDDVGWVMRAKIPRGGNSRTEGIPLFSYTLKGVSETPDSGTPEMHGIRWAPRGHEDDVCLSWHRSLLMRSGLGESMRRGGKGVTVSLLPRYKREQRRAQLDDPINTAADPKSVDQARFLTERDSQRYQPWRFAELLCRFGIVHDESGGLDLTPEYVVWTESLSGEMGPPRPVVRFVPGTRMPDDDLRQPDGRMR